MNAFWRIGSTLVLVAIPAFAQVTTSQYNNSRTGATLHEKILTPQNVSTKQFGKLGAFKVDGAVYAQPLYLPSVDVPGKGTHDVLYVATEHDSVYAFDANRPGDPPLWQVSFLDKARGVIPVSEDDAQCPFIRPEVGITSTPVIDLQTGTLLCTRSHPDQTRSRRQRIFPAPARPRHHHRCRKVRRPQTLISAARVPGKGAGGVQRTSGFRSAERKSAGSALTLANGVLYLEWASSCDVDPYHGWVMAYDPQTLAQRAVLNVKHPTEAKLGSGWPTLDPPPTLMATSTSPLATARSMPDLAGRDYGDSVLKVAIDGSSSSLVIRDYFTPARSGPHQRSRF